MKARHIAVVALSAFAAIAGFRLRGRRCYSTRALALDGHPRHWEGSGIPSHLAPQRQARRGLD